MESIFRAFRSEPAVNSFSISSSGNDAYGDASLATDVICAVLYLLMCLISVVILLVNKFKQQRKLTSMTLGFYICLIVFMFCRMIWLIIEAANYDWDTNKTISEGLDFFNKVWNRVCFCVFLLVFLLVLFCWVDIIHTTQGSFYANNAISGELDFKFTKKNNRPWFFVVLIILVLVILVLAIVRVSLKAQHNPDLDIHVRNIEYSNNIIISILFLFFGVTLLVYGSILVHRARQSSEGKKVEGIWWTIIVSVIVLICFIIRAVMFCLQIMSKKQVQGDAFQILTYPIPEIVPAIFVLVFMNLKISKDSEEHAGAQEKVHDPLDDELKDNDQRLAELDTH